MIATKGLVEAEQEMESQVAMLNPGAVIGRVLRVRRKGSDLVAHFCVRVTIDDGKGPGIFGLTRQVWEFDANKERLCVWPGEMADLTHTVRVWKTGLTEEEVRAELLKVQPYVILGNLVVTTWTPVWFDTAASLTPPEAAKKSLFKAIYS